MIGSPEMTVTGITAEGDRVPVLVEGRWQILTPVDQVGERFSSRCWSRSRRGAGAAERARLEIV